MAVSPDWYLFRVLTKDQVKSSLELSTAHSTGLAISEILKSAPQLPLQLLYHKAVPKLIVRPLLDSQNRRPCSNVWPFPLEGGLPMAVRAHQMEYGVTQREQLNSARSWPVSHGPYPEGPDTKIITDLGPKSYNNHGL